MSERYQPTRVRYRIGTYIEFTDFVLHFSNKVVPGMIGKVIMSGDCDPYPCPYIWASVIPFKNDILLERSDLEKIKNANQLELF